MPDRAVYKLIARNLAGEMGYIKEAEHHDLYLQFCAGLGITRDELLDHLPLASTIGAASTMGYYCRNSFEEGLGAFGLAVEMEVPGRPNGAQGDLRRPQAPLQPRRQRARVLGDPHAGRGGARRERRGGAGASAARRASSRRVIRRAFRFSVLAHAGMTEGYDRFLDTPQ